MEPCDPRHVLLMAPLLQVTQFSKPQTGTLVRLQIRVHMGTVGWQVINWGSG